MAYASMNRASFFRSRCSKKTDMLLGLSRARASQSHARVGSRQCVSRVRYARLRLLAVGSIRAGRREQSSKKGLRFGCVGIGTRPGTALVIDETDDGEGGAARSNMCGCRPHDAGRCVKRVQIPPMRGGEESPLGEGRHEPAEPHSKR